MLLTLIGLPLLVAAATAAPLSIALHRARRNLADTRAKLANEKVAHATDIDIAEDAHRLMRTTIRILHLRAEEAEEQRDEAVLLAEAHEHSIALLVAGDEVGAQPIRAVA